MTKLPLCTAVKSCLSMVLMTSVVTLYAPLINAAPIYKVVDEKTGQVTFTDNPQPYTQQSDKQVSQTSIATHTNSRASTAAPRGSMGSQTAPPPIAVPSTTTPRISYQLMMTEPSEERAYRRPAQSINVTVQTKPALQTGDSVRIYLDDKEVAQGLSASIATIDLLPGSHSVQARITNKEGRTIEQVSRTVYVIQNTQTLQNNKKIAQQLLAYERLPWHQKMLLKLRQDKSRAQQAQSTTLSP